MRNFSFVFVVLMLVAAAGMAQVAGPLLSVPQGINYQAVVRDNNGNASANTIVSFRVSILKGSATGSSQYTETHRVTTSAAGLANFVVFRGTYVSGDASLFTWFQQGPYYLKVEMDQTGGSAYQLIGASELLSVPYALNAGNSINAWQAGPYYKVGDLAEGGMVIATWDGGRHGWVVALEDEAKDISWDDANLLIQADTAGGYRDWVLPTIAQLELIYKLRNNIEGLTSLEYWSSSLISVLEYEASSFTVYNEEALLMIFNESLEDNGTVEEAPKCCRGKKSDGTAARAVRVF